MTERDEVKRMEVRHQMLVSRVIKRADGSTRLWHNITESMARRRGGQILKKEEDAKPSARFQGNCGQNTGSVNAEVQDLEEKPWRNLELKEQEQRSSDSKKGDEEVKRRN